jgi:hypothetical protein
MIESQKEIVPRIAVYLMATQRTQVVSATEAYDMPR